MSTAQHSGEVVIACDCGANRDNRWPHHDECSVYRTTPPSAPDYPITATCRVCDYDYRCVPVPAKCGTCGADLPPSVDVGVEATTLERIALLFTRSGTYFVGDRDECLEKARQAVTLAQQPTAIPRLANCGKYTATDNNGQHYYLNHANTWQAFQGQQPATPIGEAVATVSGEFSEVRQDGEVYWLQTVLLKRPQQLPFGAPLYTAPQQPAAVDDAMVERACKAAAAQCEPNEVWPDDYEEADDIRAMMKAALTAALAGQQGGEK